jgi:CDGSH-type Zn-finger protein
MAEIRIERGGPMRVKGATLARLIHDGDRWSTEPIEVVGVYALCRCGRSGRMPFCDRAANDANRCFPEAPATGPDPGPFRWDVPDPAGPPAVALKPDGPARVAGGIPVVYDGRMLAPVDRTSLCRCGASRCQPLCDSSHKVVGFAG